jgi:hypothetical protein
VSFEICDVAWGHARYTSATANRIRIPVAPSADAYNLAGSLDGDDHAGTLDILCIGDAHGLKRRQRSWIIQPLCNNVAGTLESIFHIPITPDPNNVSAVGYADNKYATVRVGKARDVFAESDGGGLLRRTWRTPHVQRFLEIPQLAIPSCLKNSFPNEVAPKRLAVQEVPFLETRFDINLNIAK